MRKRYSIRLDDPKMFVGAVVTKTRVRAVCVGVEDYVRRDGKASLVLKWECEWLEDGTKINATTSANFFNIGDIPNKKKYFFPKEKNDGSTREA